MADLLGPDPLLKGESLILLVLGTGSEISHFFPVPLNKPLWVWIDVRSCTWDSLWLLHSMLVSRPPEILLFQSMHWEIERLTLLWGISQWITCIRWSLTIVGCISTQRSGKTSRRFILPNVLSSLDRVCLLPSWRLSQVNHGPLAVNSNKSVSRIVKILHGASIDLAYHLLSAQHSSPQLPPTEHHYAYTAA